MANLVTAGLAASTQEEATQLSQALLDWAATSSVRAAGIADVDTSIKLGATVQVADAGPLSRDVPGHQGGDTYRARHGFLTRFWSGGRGQTVLASADGGSRYGPLQGPATHHPGMVVGEVTNINDPKKMGRVKVRFRGSTRPKRAPGQAPSPVEAPAGGTS